MSDSVTKENERLIIYAVAAVLSLLILTIGSCSVLTSEDDLKEEIAELQAEANVEKARYQAKIKKYEAEEHAEQVIKEMVANGADPVAARCAIWLGQ